MTNHVPLPEPLMSPPDAGEMAQRVERVRERMAREGIDAYIVHCPDNLFYLTQFQNYIHERPFVLVVPQSGPLRFVAPQLEEEHVRIRSIGEIEVYRYFEFPAPPGEEWSLRLRDALGDATRVGLESACPLQVMEEISLPWLRSDIVDEIRFVKSAYEIGRITHASRIVSEGHRELLAASKPGAAVIGLFSEVTRSMTVQMLRDMPHANMLASHFAAIVQPPSRSHDPHNFSDVFAQLEEGGPHVTVVNCRVNGYGAEVERSFFLGSVPDAARKPFDAMLEARRIAFEVLRPGAVMSQIDQRVRDHFDRSGYQGNLLHRTGHSFGVTGHEAPFLAVGYDHIVEPGMLFSIEPGIYIDGLGGFRFSDTVLVTESGPVQLTGAPERLEELVLEH